MTAAKEQPKPSYCPYCGSFGCPFRGAWLRWCPHCRITYVIAYARRLRKKPKGKT